MPKFTANTTFQYANAIRREGSTLTVDKDMLQVEIDMGKHPDTGRPMSGLLNHCSPADEDTTDLVQGFSQPKEQALELCDEEKAARVKEIQAEMDEMGVAYHPAWKLSRMEKELIKAKKEKGL